MTCSLCGAEGTNKSTCPLNPLAKAKNYEKHKVSKAKSGAVAVAVKPAKPKSKAVKPAKPKPKAVKPKHVKPAEQENIEDVVANAQREAKKLFPKDKKKQQEYVDDVLKLHIDMTIPAVPVHYNAISTDIKTNCDACYKYIKARGKVPKTMTKSTFYGNMSNYCSGCRTAIAQQYKQDQIDNRHRYKKYHKDELDIDTILAHGNKGEYFNATMYDASVFWGDVAGRKFGESLPSVPKGRPK